MKFAPSPNRRRKVAAVLRWGVVAGLCLATAPVAWAEALWHCSRSRNVESNFQLSSLQDKSQGGTLRKFDLSNTDVIELELTDLYSIFSGEEVVMGRTRLSGCYIKGRSRLHLEAMDMLGINPDLSAVANKKAADGKPYLYPVADEDGMAECIANHHPAFGYMSEATNNDSMSTCF